MISKEEKKKWRKNNIFISNRLIKIIIKFIGEKQGYFVNSDHENYKVPFIKRLLTFC